MKNFLIVQFWFTIIVVCECLKWVAAAKLTQYIGWLNSLVK